MDIHFLKIVSEHYEAVDKGIKKAELRKNDRGFKVGDYMVLQEIYAKHPHLYTGRQLLCRITHILTDRQFGGLQEGYCIISFDKKENFDEI